ncbi:hypothetical protein DL764_004162 [Monosporascus ibericus]|uniref:ASTRA-associated protein 1 n=1 Tax=Monosporascus ibericus TaxID=155417 RepID=A0A4Q4TFK0_9PEZI|nr:hypothetical protein DL764_004162 [Monosporascus ibericus]
MTSQRPAAQPKSVLRGHKAQVHATTFVKSNQRLASGDAEGFIVLWDLTIMRPSAVWRAHEKAILGIAGWGEDKIITHGRDNRLVVWKAAADDEVALSTALPLDQTVSARPQPWILHVLEVNSMNFCSFAQCTPDPGPATDELLIAVPNTLSSESLASKAAKIGMPMALSLFLLDRSLMLIAAYENGLALVARLRRSGSWDIVYKAQSHSQPILSLDVSPGRDYFLTSGADAIIAKHPIPGTGPPSQESSGAETQHSVIALESGQEDILASTPSQPVGAPTSLLSTALAGGSRPTKLGQKAGVSCKTLPAKTINTKHSGQQGLRIRSDGKIFTTAGWDSKVRVYSTKTMSELAVLKWHDVGCYTTAFAIVDGRDNPSVEVERGSETQFYEKSSDKDRSAVEVVPRLGELSVRDQRIKQTKEAHWLAVGSKDGKVSLWDIY